MSNGELKKQQIRLSKCSLEQHKVAIEYNLSHGKNMNNRIQALSYPSRAILSKWLAEDRPKGKRYCKHGAPEVYLMQEQREQREQTTIDMCTRSGSTKEIADKCHRGQWLRSYDYTDICNDIFDIVMDGDMFKAILKFIKYS